MLQELSIKNFAIIDSIALSFEEGLTVLSGETGAGKSIIIDAIHLLVGGRGSSEFVRHGEKKAEIEGLFLLDDPRHPCHAKASEFGIDIEEGMIVLRRDISSTGKSVCRVNGKLVTIATMREIGSTLIDIHGQHEHQELMNEHLHLTLLDQFGGKDIASSLTAYLDVFEEYQTVARQLKRLNENEQEMAHRLDLIQFQQKEIQDAELRLHEDDELQDEKLKLVNFEKLYEALQTSYDSLRGERKGMDWAGLAMGHLETAAEVDAQFGGTLESVSSAYYILEDAAHAIRAELDQLEFEPGRLDMIESRLNEINGLKRKYGSSIEEVLAYGSRIEEEIETIVNKDSHVQQLQDQLRSLENDLSVEAENLTIARKKWAKKLTVSIHEQLKQLYMDKTKFEVKFLTDGDAVNRKFKKDGWDEVEFYISTNPGEPLKPLSKVASGGELSRIMLALKTIFSKHQGITSIIFDEVDTGVSGRVAQSIAEKIYQVAVHSQVMCISHLPQVAAMADCHLFISKKQANGRTSTKVKRLEENEKIQEISRMISGVEITDLTLEHAKELLHLAGSIKET
ncbi:DNA repair protein RecN [Rossellomorea marisflavi]|uniref:DNA repair protein RecN n=1 Tax=Rossellomorea marisflavi TaxID=189381 RepID=UPI00070043DC|nr:DNA repair protein RecN [Rossellomorea marisflavi]KQU59667.1 DNA repair protein RecN [Bacillus sp. Leaf406]UKS63963.1 DNA repair protein RecN [Rossellomorea marisflavi]WJV20417.1 DNA repair protein RecN [Rossellomorea marisflavi]